MSWDTGDNKSFWINCKYTVMDHWMAYICFYALRKSMPDSWIGIKCKKVGRPVESLCCLFGWPVKLDYPFKYVKEHELEHQAKDNLFIINCTTLAVRSWDGFEISHVSSDKPTTFVDIKDGWGNFKPEYWIDRMEAPFDRIDSFLKPEMSVNERKVAELWKKAKITYSAMTGW